MTPTQLADVMARNRITPKGIIHYGGVGEEIEAYERLGFKRILIVQPDRVSLDQIRVKTGTRQHVLGVQCYLGEENGYRLDGETLTPVSRLDSLLVELRCHPRDFNVFQAGEEMNCRELGADQVVEYLEIAGDNVNPLPRVLNLWQKPHGRFANEIFQYFFAHVLAQHHGLELRTPPWFGQRLFGLSNPLLERELPTLEEHDPRPETSSLFRSLTSADEPIPAGTCLFGNFQFHTGLWSEKKRQLFRDLFAPGPLLRNVLPAAFRKMVGDRTLVAIHVRREDYSAGSPGPFYATPVESYKKWLAEIWPLLNNPVLYVASDDPRIAAEFTEYPVVTWRDMAVHLAEGFYVDFWVLTQAHALAISNSSFSFAAAMLNERAEACGIYCVRPLHDGTMRPFEPWNDDVLLHRYDVPMFGVDASSYVPGAELSATVPMPVKSSEDMCLRLLADILPKVDPNHEGAFIEVGLGTFAWFFEHFSPQGWQCHAIEPMPTPQLEARCMALGASLATAVMGATDGHAVLEQGRTNDLNSIVPNWWGVDTTGGVVNRIEVKSMKYGTFLNFIPQKKVACLKIDVEGAEWQVIGGITPENAPAVIMFEAGGTPQSKRQGGWTDEAVDRTNFCLLHLYDMGYRTAWIVEGQGFEPTKVSMAGVLTHFRQFKDYEINRLYCGVDYLNIIAIREESQS